MFGLFKKKPKEDKASWTIWMKSQRCIECEAIAPLCPRSPHRARFINGVCHKCGYTEIDNVIVKYKREIIHLYYSTFYIVEKFMIRGDAKEYDI